MKHIAHQICRLGLALPLFICVLYFFVTVPITHAAISDQSQPVPSAEPYQVEECDYEFSSSEELRHYAYMDLESAPDDIKPIIRKAREKIIRNTSYAADDVDCYVVDSEGNIIKELPHFSEIFPSDWEPLRLY